MIVMYQADHPPKHVHIFRDNALLDRYDLEHGCFMDGTVGKHERRALTALESAGLKEKKHHGRKE